MKHSTVADEQEKRLRQRLIREFDEPRVTQAQLDAMFLRDYLRYRKAWRFLRNLEQ